MKAAPPRRVSLDPALTLGLALLFGAALATSPLPCAISATLLLLVFRLRWRMRALIVLLLLCSGWRARAALADYERQRVSARDAIGAPARCFGRGRALESSAGVADRAHAVIVVEQAQCDGRSLPSGLRAKVYGVAGPVSRGDVFDFTAELGPPRMFRNLDVTDPLPHWALRGVVLSGVLLDSTPLTSGTGLYAWIDHGRAHARARIERTFAPGVRAMARALVLGDTDLDPVDQEAFKSSGLAHILAVSGTHLVFAVLAVVQALRFTLVRVKRLSAVLDVQRVACAVGLVLALLYADFAGGSGSAWRAAWMLGAGFWATVCGRRANGMRALGVSLIVGAVTEPLALFDLSFMLSAAATLGLMTAGRAVAPMLRQVRRAPVRWAVQNMAASSAAMLGSAPILALMTPDLTFAGVIASLVAGPIGETVALPICLLHACFSQVPALERGAAIVGSGALWVVKTIAHLAARVELLSVPVPDPNAWHVALIVAASALVFLSRSLSRIAAAAGAIAGLMAVEIAAQHSGSPRGELRVSALDVEQGDSTLVDLPDGSLMLVDAGGFMGTSIDPGAMVVAPLLRARRRERIDVVVLSHPHPDHFGGLASAIAGRSVGEFWDTGQGAAHGAGPVYKELRNELQRRGIPVLGPAQLCGKARHYGRATVRVLAPCPDYDGSAGANDNSFVIHIQYGARAVLLTGDAEQAAESQLVETAGAMLRADLLKVGHHGSRTSSTEPFLARVRPQLATVSCGVRNRFGHPHAEAMARLTAAGAYALRLDRTGGIEWRTDGDRHSSRAYSLPR